MTLSLQLLRTLRLVVSTLVLKAGLDGFGLVEAPFGEGLEEAELGRVSEGVGD